MGWLEGIFVMGKDLGLDFLFEMGSLPEVWGVSPEVWEFFSQRFHNQKYFRNIWMIVAGWHFPDMTSLPSAFREIATPWPKKI